eukprot:jgi/Mesvir1/15708/Mv03289-RA.1
MWGRFMTDKYPEDFVDDDDFGKTWSGSDEELGSEPEWPSGSDVSVADDDEVDARSDIASSQVSWGLQLSIGAPVLDMSHLVELKKYLRNLDADMRARGLAESAADAAAAVAATPVATWDDSRTGDDPAARARPPSLRQPTTDARTAQQSATGAPRDVPAARALSTSSRQPTTGARNLPAARPGDDGAASSCGCTDCADFDDLMGAFVDLPLTAGRQVTFMWAGNSCHYDAALEFLYVVLLVTQTATRSGLRSLLSRPPGVAHGAACKIGVVVFWAMAAVACEDGSGMTAAREAVRELLDPTMARKPGDMQCALEDVEHMMAPMMLWNRDDHTTLAAHMASAYKELKIVRCPRVDCTAGSSCVQKVYFPEVPPFFAFGGVWQMYLDRGAAHRLGCLNLCRWPCRSATRVNRCT